MKWLSKIMGVDPKCHHKCPWRERQREVTHREKRRRPGDHETETRVRSGNVKKHQKLEEVRNGFFPRASADVPKLRTPKWDPPGLSKRTLNQRHVSLKGQMRRNRHREKAVWRRRQRLAFAFTRQGMPAEDRRGNGGFAPKSLKGLWPCQSLVFRLMASRPVANTFLLLWATHTMVLNYCSLWKQTHTAYLPNVIPHLLHYVRAIQAMCTRAIYTIQTMCTRKHDSGNKTKFDLVTSATLTISMVLGPW